MLLTLILAAATACARGGTLPEAGASDAPVPDLRGARVMLYPNQSLQGIAGDVDAEIAYALAQRPGQVTWVLPAEMRRALAESPGMDVRLDGLPVGMFLQAQVQRVGDPLFGYLRRMSALVNSDIALLPVFTHYRPGGASRPSAVEIAVALISARTGQVLWFGLVEGEAGGPNDPRALATAADALGRRLLPFPRSD